MAVFVGHVGDGLDPEAVARAHGAQQLDVAAALVAVAEVFAHQQPAGVQAAHQQLLDEGLGRHVGQVLVEAFQGDLLDAVVLQRPHLVAQAADLRGNQFGAAALAGEIGARMRLEGHDGGSQAAFAGQLADLCQDGLVAAVDAVEIADGYRAGAIAIVTGKGAINYWGRFHV